MEDERIFSETAMWDFAYRIAQEAMAAAFEGKKTIDDLSLEEYITKELKNEPGS